MSAIDPKLMLRLEPALRCLVKHPNHALSYIAHRFEVDKGDLALWLNEYNGGRKELTEARIDEVKKQAGTISSGKLVTRETDVVIAGGSRHGKTFMTAQVTAHLAETSASTPEAKPIKLAHPTSNIGAWLDEQKAKTVGVAHCYQVEVTPAIARAWLTLNTGNRKPSKAKIRRFTAAMKAGTWILNGETIKFSITGRLLDGQSRLQAIVNAGVTVALEIRGALPDVAQKTMDCGELRKTSHTLEMLGEHNPNELAAALKMCWLFEKGMLGGNKFGDSAVLENSEVPALIARHPGIKASVGWAKQKADDVRLLMTISEMAFFHYLLGCIDVSARDKFLDELIDGESISKSQPVYHARKLLMVARRDGGAYSQARMRRFVVVKTWNASRAGERWTEVPVKPNEAFPAVNGWEGGKAA